LPPPPPPAPVVTGLTTEEQEIFKRLQDKVNRMSSAEELKKDDKRQSVRNQLVDWYQENMASMRKFIS
jgi:hypothetical protein